jgi:predicted cobalt transporter CbtA
MDLTKKELSSLAVFALFLAFWSYVFVPQFQKWIREWSSPSPLFFYPLFNVVYVVMFSFLTYMLLIILGKKGTFRGLMVSAFRYGIAGFVLLWMIPDLIAPPYLVTMEGELLTAHPLWPAVADSFWYTVFQPYVPASMMYLTVYFAVPVLMFLFVLLLVSPRRLAKLVKEL